MLYNIIVGFFGVLFGVSLIIYVFSTRQGFFGLVLGLASFFLIFTILSITGILIDEGGKLLSIVYMSILGVGIFSYTFGIGKVINIFLAVIMWLSVYFNFITIDGGLLNGDLLNGDPLKGLLIYLTVAGIASLFTLDSY